MAVMPLLIGVCLVASSLLLMRRLLFEHRARRDVASLGAGPWSGSPIAVLDDSVISCGPTFTSVKDDPSPVTRPTVAHIAFLATFRSDPLGYRVKTSPWQEVASPASNPLAPTCMGHMLLLLQHIVVSRHLQRIVLQLNNTQVVLRRGS